MVCGAAMALLFVACKMGAFEHNRDKDAWYKVGEWLTKDFGSCFSRPDGYLYEFARYSNHKTDNDFSV
jgi:hypothetical protein